MGTTTIVPVIPTVSQVHRLCDLLLEVAGRDMNRLPSVRRHVRVLDEALPWMSAVQRDAALAKIDKLQTKWGSLFADPEKHPKIEGIPPEIRAVQWVSQRRYPERYLNIMHEAAKAVMAGERSIHIIQDRAYLQEPDMLARWVSYDAFKEWLLILRIVRQAGKGTFEPGELAQWWADEMSPSRDRSSAFAICMKLLSQR